MRPNGADESISSHSHLPKSPFMGTESAAAAATAENGALNEGNTAIDVVVDDSPPASASASASASVSLPGAPYDQYRMHLYNYALQAQAERLRFVQSYGASVTSASLCPTFAAAAAAAAAATAAAAAAANAGSGGVQYAPRWPFPISLFQNRLSADEPKPQYSYIGLIAMAILSSPETKLVLSDIYQYILDNYPYFRSRGPGWRNSIRHNLSLNDCFIKAGRSANGKGHYWAIHPANVDDFKKGDFRRRKAQRKVRKHMGLAVDDDGNDSPSPPPITPPPLPPPPPSVQQQPAACTLWPAGPPPFVFPASLSAAASATTCPAGIEFSRKRQFDVASLLAPDDNACGKRRHRQPSPPPPPPYPSLPLWRPKRATLRIEKTHTRYSSASSLTSSADPTHHLQFLSSSSGDEDDTLTDVDVTAGADHSTPPSPTSTSIGAPLSPQPPSSVVDPATSVHAFAPPTSWTLSAALTSAAGAPSPQHQQLVAKYYERLNQARTIRLYQQLQLQQRRLCVVDTENGPAVDEAVENNG